MTKSYTKESILKANKCADKLGVFFGYGFCTDGDFELYSSTEYLSPEEIKLLYEASLLLEEEV